MGWNLPALSVLSEMGVVLLFPHINMGSGTQWKITFFPVDMQPQHEASGSDLWRGLTVSLSEGPLRGPGVWLLPSPGGDGAPSCPVALTSEAPVNLPTCLVTLKCFRR